MTTTVPPPSGPPPSGPPPSGPGARPRTVEPWVLVAFALGGLVFVAIAVGALVLAGGDDAVATDPTRWQGTVLEPAPERPDFVLTDTGGQPFDFRAETGGQLTLLFYGYTNCPDVCPIHMATIAQALDRVNVDARVVFVTTDPARDTPERIRAWLDGFDPEFIGLTGNDDDVARAQQAMGASVAQKGEADAAGDYEVGHNAGVWVITPDDRVHLLYGFGTREQDWVTDLPEISTEPAWAAAGTTP